MALFQRALPTEQILPMLTALLLTAWAGGSPAMANPDTLLPDLSFQFSCPKSSPTEVEDAIEQFLTRQGFKVLNLGRLQRAHNVPNPNTMMTALDEKDRTVEIDSFVRVSADYGLSLTTPPPTKHLVVLEEAIMKFVADELHCPIARLARHDNDASAATSYYRDIERTKTLFREADELKNQSRP